MERKKNPGKRIATISWPSSQNKVVASFVTTVWHSGLNELPKRNLPEKPTCDV